MLSTPPAFILSQDQTLVKSVCIQSRIATSYSIPFTVLIIKISLGDGCIINDAVLKNFLYKKFSRVCCLLFNYQGPFVVLCCRLLSSAATFIDYHIVRCLSRTFFIFFSAESRSIPFPQATALICYHTASSLSTTFYNLKLNVKYMIRNT